MDIITQHKHEIEAMLNELQLEFEKNFGQFPYAFDVFSRIFPYSQKGKLIRGGLVIMGATMKGQPVNRDVLLTAALMELVHAALLVHDDIMDDDAMRRGEVSMHMQYEHKALAANAKNPQQLGRALGICIGDCIFFIVFNVLSHLDTKHKNSMMQLLSRELLIVGFGQMQDVWPEQITEKKILELYKYKTGRYSFSLPILLGTLFNGNDIVLEKEILLLGELMGQLFQITDDYLGLYGSAQMIGKPVGSDIKEGKQTLYWYLLNKKAKKQDKEKLQALMGKDIQEKDIIFVKELLTTYGINEKIDGIKKKLESEVFALISSMHIEEKDKEIVKQLLVFISSRDK